LAVHEWLQSTEGQSMISRTLQAHRLPSSFDADVERMVLRSAATATSRGARIDSAPAWATSCLRNRVKDLLRSPMSKRAPRRDRPHDDLTDDEARFGADTGDGAIERFETSQVADEVRRQLLMTGTHGWQVAGGLAVLAVGVDGAEPGARCPRPVGGAGELEAGNWAGLWYAGRHDCFDADADTDVVRKRRSRAAAALRSALVEAGSAAGLNGAIGA
jgi:hypothetical protein